MFRSSSFYHYSHNHVPTTSFKKSFFFFIPTTLALLTSLFILFYVYSTSIIFTHHHHHHKFQPILHFKSSSSNFTLSLHKNHSEFIKSHTYQLGDHIHGLGPQSQQGLSHDQSSLKGMQKFQIFNISINNIIC
jgi:hypothetical protein